MSIQRAYIVLIGFALAQQTFVRWDCSVAHSLCPRGPKFQLNADLTRSGENGTRRIRTPVASNMAFAMAAATGRIDGSPAPVGAISGWLISTTFTSAGVSVISRIG